MQYYANHLHISYLHNAIKNDMLRFSWQPESKFPFAQVRLPPKDGPMPEFKENQEVEVFSRSNEHEACGWWKAIIKVSKNKLSYCFYALFIQESI